MKGDRIYLNCFPEIDERNPRAKMLVSHAYCMELKNGKPGKRIELDYCWYSPLIECNNCGKLGPTHRTMYRHELWRFAELAYGIYMPTETAKLCMSCWNGIGPAVRRFLECDEIRKTINRIRRKAHEQKRATERDQNHRTASGNAREIACRG